MLQAARSGRPRYLRDEQETCRKVKGALTYPAIMLAFAVCTTIFLLAFVLPKFTVIYANKKAALPLPTKVLMPSAHSSSTTGSLLLVGAIGLVVGIHLPHSHATGPQRLALLPAAHAADGAACTASCTSRAACG